MSFTDVFQFILNNFGTIIASGLALALAWGIRKIGLQKAAEDAIIAFTRRVVDKSKAWLDIATAPGSDGGVRITTSELSELRQKVWDLIKEEAKGPVGKILLSWGEQQVKGIIGLVLTKMGIKASGDV